MDGGQTFDKSQTTANGGSDRRSAFIFCGCEKKSMPPHPPHPVTVFSQPNHASIKLLYIQPSNPYLLFFINVIICTNTGAHCRRSTPSEIRLANPIHPLAAIIPDPNMRCTFSFSRHQFSTTNFQSLANTTSPLTPTNDSHAIRSFSPLLFPSPHHPLGFRSPPPPPSAPRCSLLALSP